MNIYIYIMIYIENVIEHTELDEGVGVEFEVHSAFLRCITGMMAMGSGTLWRTT